MIDVIMSSCLRVARMHAIVCVAADYPHTPPVVAVLIELTSGQKQPYDIHMKVCKNQ